jgi:hypothetical protein
VCCASRACFHSALCRLRYPCSFWSLTDYLIRVLKRENSYRNTCVLKSHHSLSACTDWDSDNGSWLVFGKCPVWISAGTPAILTTVFGGFSPSFHEGPEITSQTAITSFLLLWIHRPSAFRRCIYWQLEAGFKSWYEFSLMSISAGGSCILISNW